jgi:hypothetical protein
MWGRVGWVDAAETPPVRISLHFEFRQSEAEDVKETLSVGAVQGQGWCSGVPTLPLSDHDLVLVIPRRVRARMPDT